MALDAPYQEAEKKIKEVQRTGATELSLINMGLAELPESLGQLTQLQWLFLYDNRLTVLPEWLGQLTLLQRLNLGGNQLTALPDSFRQLKQLQELYLSNNRLTALPEWVRQLTQLQILSLDSNQLISLPESLGQLIQLQKLYLHDNQLTTLPESFWQLTQLRELFLWNNQLTSLPKAFGQLSQLQWLDLRKNHLTAVPESLGQLTQLHSLNLSENHLTVLPESLGQLTQLQWFGISYNQLTVLPSELGNLTNLKELRFDNNHLISPPPEIINQGKDAILVFLREQLENSCQEWVSKLMVVGEGGVGKTSLLRALNGRPFDPELSTTHGIRIEALTLQHPYEKDVTMTLNTWDFGGQEIYHATHQFFLTNRSLFLLTWNARHGYEQGKLFYWLDQIQARAPNSPVLVVATWIDERGADLPAAELEAKYPQILGFCAVSNKTGTDIEDLRAALTRAAADLPLMGVYWPTDWLKTAEAIRDMDEKHITSQELRRIMTKHGVEEPDVPILAEWLHELGDILYFQQDENLNDLVILKPQWVTEYISKVLESEDVIGRSGIFTRTHMDRLWGNLDPEMRDHFLRLMECFDLSYRTLENREISMVVERLPLDPPNYDDQWQAVLRREPCREITLRYWLNTLPPGIPTWFIARSHRFTTHTHWRSGAVFTDPPERDHLALVKASSHDRCIHLTVRGPNPHNFFTLLKDGLEVTLARFPGLKIERMMPCPGHSNEPCSHEFNYLHLQKALEKNVWDIQCPVSFESVSVPTLLFGLDWRTQDAVLQRIDEIVIKQNALLAIQETTLQELKELRALTQRSFLNIFRREQSKIDSACPNVFVLRPYHTSRFKKRLAGETYYLKLYCQAPGAWHPVQEGGLYEIDHPAEWLQATAPYLRKMVSVLKYVAPLVGPWMSASHEEYVKLAQDDVRVMTELIKKLPNIETDRSLQHVQRVGERFEEQVGGAALRILREILEEKDPDHVWGGLQKVLTPEGHYLWLCEHHSKEYRV